MIFFRRQENIMDFAKILEGIFTSILYPLAIVLILYFIYDMLRHLVYRSGSNNSALRRLVAAWLPVISLIFLLLMESSYDRLAINAYIISLKGFFKFFIGVLLGVEIYFLRKYFYRSASDLSAIIICLFLSSFGSFILYNIMRGYLPGILPIIFGMVLSGGLIVISFGLRESKKKQHRMLIVIAILAVNGLITAGMILKPEWVMMKDISKQIQALEKRFNMLTKEDEPTEREQAYIEMLQESLLYPDIDTTKFKSAIEQLKLLKATHKIPVSDLTAILEAAYPKGYEGAENFSPEYRDVAVIIVNLLARLEAGDACDILYDIEALTHGKKDKTLHDATRKAAKMICEHQSNKDR